MRHYDAFISRFNKDIRDKHLFNNTKLALPFLYFRNSYFQPEPDSAPVEEALQNFKLDLLSAVISKFTSQPRGNNLIKQQQTLLNEIYTYPTIMVIGSDKNLRQCVIERAKHKKMLHEHLNNANAYGQLTQSEANSTLSDAVANFFELIDEAKNEDNIIIRTTCFEESDGAYVKRMINQKSRHTQFYSLAKIHKNVNPVLTRPVLGAAGSPPFIMSKMLDSLL